MSVPTIDDVRPILQAFELRLRKVLEAAWDEDWQSMPTRQKSLLSKRSRASCMFDFAKHRAIREFTGDSEIQMIHKGQTVKFLFQNSVLARIKKANARGLGSNIETQAVLEFVDPQFKMFDLPPLHHVEICYQEDNFATRISSISVTARQLYRRIWSYELQRPQTATITPIISATTVDDEVPRATVRPRVVAEKQDEQG
jgi:hypothetical protein